MQLMIRLRHGQERSHERPGVRRSTSGQRQRYGLDTWSKKDKQRSRATLEDHLGTGQVDGTALGTGDIGGRATLSLNHEDQAFFCRLHVSS
ncbi:unnamed protein product [Lota lota]